MCMVTISKPEIAKLLKASKLEMSKLTTPKKFENKVNKIYDTFVETYNLPLVKSIKIQMNWTNSKNWGMLPSAEAYVEYVNGKYGKYNDKINTGSGYDKAMSLIQRILNDHAKQNILHKRIIPEKIYPGVRLFSKLHLPIYTLNNDEGKFFNFTIKHTISTPMYDEYEIKFK